MTFVRTKLKLERMQPGEVLSVRLQRRGALAQRPARARARKATPFWGSKPTARPIS